MMDFENKPQRTQGNRRLIYWIIVYVILFTFLLLISNIKAINSWTGYVVTLLRPILIGLALAYIANPFFRFFERKLLARIRHSYLRRVLALILTYLFLFLIVAALIVLIVPQVVQSIESFVDHFEERLTNLISPINRIIASINSRFPVRDNGEPFITPLNRDNIFNGMRSLWNYLKEQFKERVGFSSIPRLLTFLSTAASGLANLIFGIFLSIYLLFSKEKRYAQIMKLRYALFKDSTNRHITHICTVADRSFGGFLRGKILDSLIVGLLTFAACSLFHIQYALLIAAIVGITDIIPVVGPIIGVVPTALIILLEDPVKVIFFILSIIVIQQLDGNIIAPKILGENTGVSSLCVMVAIILMGGVWGFIGMLVGVPLFATVLELLDYWLDSRLKKRNLPNNIENYYSPDSVARRLETATERRRKKRKKGRDAQVLAEETGTGDLSFGERMRLRTYQTALKYHLFSDISEEELEQFLKEENQPDLALSAEAGSPALPEQVPLDTFLSNSPADLINENFGKEDGSNESK